MDQGLSFSRGALLRAWSGDLMPVITVVEPIRKQSGSLLRFFRALSVQIGISGERHDAFLCRLLRSAAPEDIEVVERSLADLEDYPVLHAT